MVSITINKKTYKGCENWGEMPCSLASAIFTIPMPETLKEYYKVSISGDEALIDKYLLNISDTDQFKTFPEYYGKIIQVMYGMSDKEVDKIPVLQRCFIYEKYCMVFVLGLHWSPNMEHIDITEIECDGETLIIPKERIVLGVSVPCPDENTETFAEAADLALNYDRFKGGKYEVAPNLISIFCRPKGEVYNSVKSLERAEKLKDVKMDVVWEVFFCLNEFLIMREVRDLTFLINQAESKKKWQHRLRAFLRLGGTEQY